MAVLYVAATPIGNLGDLSPRGAETLKQADLIIAEVEFGSKDAAEAFVPPDWFYEDVTYCKEYHNSYMAMMDLGELS